MILIHLKTPHSVDNKYFSFLNFNNSFAKLFNMMQVTFIKNTPAPPIPLGPSNLTYLFPSHNRFGAYPNEFRDFCNRHSVVHVLSSHLVKLNGHQYLVKKQ